jgi:hypothetical protein
MNRLAFTVLAAALLCGSAYAQPAKKPAAEPAKKAEAAQQPAKKPAAAAAAAHKSRRHEDARACLEQGTNTAIIKCAEAYL